MTTKEEVLSLLLGAEGDVSGEQLSSRLRVSRAAVNTAVQSLRGAGYEIESSTRKGEASEANLVGDLSPNFHRYAV